LALSTILGCETSKSNRVSLVLSLFLDTLRKRAWPKLVGLHKYYQHNKPQYDYSKPTNKPEATPSPNLDDDEPKFEIDASVFDTPSSTTKEAPLDLIVESMDALQIERDVARCTWHLLTGTQRSRRVQYKNKDRKKVSGILNKKQRRLANLINLTLVESYELAPSHEDRLRYYQGYHDVASIFLHTLGGGQSTPGREKDDGIGLELPVRVLCQVSHSHFRDHMRHNFVSLQTALKIALFPLLSRLDPEVHAHLQYCDMEPFFCLSWILTWFAHDVRDTQLVKRLFDAFLCSHPLFPLYVAIAMMLHPVNRALILQTECDFAALHQRLASLPRNSCRVGWKQRWDGEGYISDEEGDDRTASTDMDSSNWDCPTSNASLWSLPGSVQTPNSAAVGRTNMEENGDDRVPFQVLIENALGYMKRYPPRCLMKMAQKYYQEDWAMGDNISNISLLQNPPTWSLSPKAKADWVLKQRVRQDLGLKATSRKDRRKKAQYSHSNSAENDGTADPSDEATPLVDKDYLKRNSRNLAVIAAGYGPGPEAEAARRRQRRRLASAMAVGMFAVVIGVAYQQYQSQSQASRSSSVEPSPRGAKTLFFTDDTSSTTKDSSSKSAFESNKVMSTSSVSSESSFPSVLQYCKKGSAFLFNESHGQDYVEPKAFETQESKALPAARTKIVPTMDTQKITGPPSIRATEDDTKTLLSKLTPWAAEEPQPVVHKQQPPIMMLMNKVTKSVFRIIFRIFRPWLFFLRHTENSERETPTIFLGGLRILWEKEVTPP
jgi:hypothetical protein